MIYTLKTINQKEKPGFFVYFVAKKKIFKKAVLRNKVKRIARHAFIEAKKEILNIENNTLPNKQVIFFLENGIIQESFQNIVNSFINDILKINNKNK
jgi:ribonuclease P protein component